LIPEVQEGPMQEDLLMDNGGKSGTWSRLIVCFFVLRQSVVF
jgi:hypothetical protein